MITGRREHHVQLAGGPVPDVEADIELFETMRLDTRGVRHLDHHLRRLARSARLLGFAFDQDRVLAPLASVTPRNEPQRVNLTLSRGGATAITVTPLDAVADPALVAVSRRRIRSDRPLAGHKTTDRAVYDEARAEHPAADDTLLVNERDEVIESTIAAVTYLLDGVWWTPPLQSGGWRASGVRCCSNAACSPNARSSWASWQGATRFGSSAPCAATGRPPFCTASDQSHTDRRRRCATAVCRGARLLRAGTGIHRQRLIVPCSDRERPEEELTQSLRKLPARRDDATIMNDGDPHTVEELPDLPALAELYEHVDAGLTNYARQMAGTIYGIAQRCRLSAFASEAACVAAYASLASDDAAACAVWAVLSLRFDDVDDTPWAPLTHALAAAGHHARGESVAFANRVRFVKRHAIRTGHTPFTERAAAVLARPLLPIG